MCQAYESPCRPVPCHLQFTVIFLTVDYWNICPGCIFTRNHVKDVAFKSPAWFCPYCGMLFCDTQKYTIGDDATTMVVVFCRQSHLGCTDMSLQQNRYTNA